MPQAPNQSVKTLGMLLGLAISLALLIYLLQGLDWREFAAQVKNVNPWYTPLLLLLLLLMVWLRAIRWRHLLPNGENVPLFILFKALLAGFFASFVLPLRAGELARPWLLSRWRVVPFATGLASVVTERVFDACALFVLFGLCLLKSSNVPHFVIVGAGVMGSISLLVLALVVTCFFFQSSVRRWLRRRVNRLAGGRFAPAAQRMLVIADEFMDGLAAIRSAKALALTVAWSFAIWLIMALWYQTALWACGQYPSLWVGLTVNVMIAFAVAAPSAPGFIGTFQAGCVVALAIMGPYSREFAMAYSIWVHGFQMAVIVIAGSIIAHQEGLRWRQLGSSARRA